MDKFEIQKPKNANRRIVIRTTDEMAEEIFKVAQEMNVSVNTFITNCIKYGCFIYTKNVAILCTRTL